MTDPAEIIKRAQEFCEKNYHPVMMENLLGAAERLLQENEGFKAAVLVVRDAEPHIEEAVIVNAEAWWELVALVEDCVCADGTLCLKHEREAQP